MTRRYTFCRRMAIFFLILIINEILTPSLALALTSGPTQPEMHGFEAVSTSNMVDLFTGDFNYNIPLLDAGGYPINISYHAGSSGDDESSWVGLGWSLTPGVMNRDMRGLPDDFKGDRITKQSNIKEDKTIGYNAGLKLQLVGFYLGKAKKTGVKPSLGVNLGGFYNSYRGFGVEYGISPSISLGKLVKGVDGKSDTSFTSKLNFGVNLKYNSQTGTSTDLTVGVGDLGLAKTTGKRAYSANVSIGFSSRQGLKDLTLGLGMSNVGKQQENKSYQTATGSMGSSVNFAARTYVPTNALPMKNQSFTFHGTVGAEGWALHPALQITGYNSIQSLAQNSQNQPAYGYLNSQFAAADNTSLMDYNKEKPIAYRSSQPNLPLSIGTYDLFSATGQGISGQFRAMRNDVGTFRTPSRSNKSIAGNGGFELGFGDAFHWGVEVKKTDVTNEGGDWNDEIKGAADKLTFTAAKGDENTADYEPVFIKDANESIVNEPIGNGVNPTEFRPIIGDNTPIALQLGKALGKGVFATDIMRKEQGAGTTATTLNQFSSPVKREKREKRNQVFSYLTAEEASKFGLEKNIPNNPMNSSCGTTPAGTPYFLRTERPKHHISEATVTQGDGSRYVYGIPAYNTTQEDATFSVTAPTDPSVNNGLISYQAGAEGLSASGDNTVNNKKGRDNYYDAQTLPAYAHSYLLTGILSSDYVDQTNNGITDDDLGTAVKLNYTKAHSKFRWRTPYQANQARHNEGYRLDPLDDKASYSYGEKEIWYSHSIETRTMVAKFILEDRFDALGVSDRNGTKDTNKKLKCLKRVELYSKADLLRGVSVPIKTVNFEYDYSLCKGVPNTMDEKKYGKLTLRRIYFTYGKNQSGKLNAYKFNYNGDTFKRDGTEETETVAGCTGSITQVVNSNSTDMPYNIANYDRWGSYKKPSDNLNGASNKYFPYATQNKDNADKYAKAWNMTTIELPSGGKINVEYEADDYAYVQDKRAGQMFAIKGFSKTNTGAAQPDLYEPGDMYQFMHVDISALPVTSLDDFKKRYLEDITQGKANDINQLYVNCAVRLKGIAEPTEHIKGYVDINNINDITFSADKRTAIIPLKWASSGTFSRDVNPIFKIATQTLRLELPSLAYDYLETNGSAITTGEKLAGIFPEIGKRMRGFDNYAQKQWWAKSIDITNSWVRLTNPNYKKLGGGCRVKEIRMSNYWTASATQPNDAQYGQRYTYTMLNPVDNSLMSSGVAAYEPMIGNEENLFRQPVTYEEKIKMAPNNEYYMEKPFGESLFPAPTVGYSSVKVQNLVSVDGVVKTESEAGFKRTGMGYTISEFFTAKDFPTIVDFTSKQEVNYNPSSAWSLLEFFKINKKQHTGVSQGYTIEVNDMHGKPKAEYIKNADGADISWTKYDYRTEGKGSKKLKNDGLDLVNTEGSLSKGAIGYDFDIWNDMQQDKTKTLGGGMSINNETFTAAGWPMFLLGLLSTFQYEEDVFRSAVTTKFVKRFGIMDKVTKMENGSTVSTENLLFDAETGQSLLTKTQNEFRDDIYQFSYPAHWAYGDGMGLAYKNMGLCADKVTLTTAGLIPTGFDKYFVSGDELMVLQNNGSALVNKFHVLQSEGSDKGKYLIDPVGEYLPTGTYTLKVLRSGRRNQAAASIASVVSRKDPRQGGKLVFDGQVLAAQAVTFKDEWAIRSAKTSKVGTGEKKEFKGADLNTKDFINLMAGLKAEHATNPGLLADRPLWQVISGATATTTVNLFGFSGSDTYRELTRAEPIPIACPGQRDNIAHVYRGVYQALIGRCTLSINISPGSSNSSTVNFNFESGHVSYPGSFYFNRYDQRDLHYCGGPNPNNVYQISGRASPTVTTLCDADIEQCYKFLASGEKVNPYQLGIKGNWRPEASHALYSQRTGPLSTTTKNLRFDGDVVDYQDFWVLSPVNGTNPRTYKPAPNLTKWVKANTMTQYDEKGNDVENVDALNIYSSTLFRYKNTLAAAVAANARLREIAFDGFEDYGYNYNYVENTNTTPKADCGTNHFDFAVINGDIKAKSISSKKAHTGNYSFILPANSANFTKTVPVIAPNGLHDDPNAVVLQTADKRFVNRVLQPFSLTQSTEAQKRDFLMSAWVSKDGGCTSEDLSAIKMYLTFKTSNGAVIGTRVECAPSGTIVDGWQRIENVFTMPTNAASVVVECENKAGVNVYMDDLRIFPADGKMKSFVYDARTLRLMAQLDENNYATFYEYDDEGTLVRTKRETERGIVTIQENRSTLRRPE